jgi:predicted RNA-binding protein with PUA-like domain
VAGRTDRTRAAGRLWLVKTEPETYSWERMVREGRAVWDGVRNFSARNALRAMRTGDRVLVYHSGADRAVVGIARVVREAYPDPTAEEPHWVAVDLVPERPLARAPSLAEIKADRALRGIPLVRQSRLSVMELPHAAFERIVALSRRRAPATPASPPRGRKRPRRAPDSPRTRPEAR